MRGFLLSPFYILTRCMQVISTFISLYDACAIEEELYMRLIAVHLPERIVEDIQRLVEKGLYPNRSEAIRNAIRDLLKRELWESSMNKSGRMSGVIG
jgi:hypothetical protein